jgi:hypothetical protein
LEKFEAADETPQKRRELLKIFLSHARQGASYPR